VLRKAAASDSSEDVVASDAKSTPWWWDRAWELAPEPGPDGTPIGTPEILQSLKNKVEETYYGRKRPDNAVPVVQGMSSDSVKGDLFMRLRKNFDKYGPVTRVSLGPAEAIAVADPMMVRHIFSSRGRYDKGSLGIVGGDIFGKGLITASDREVWMDRRRLVSQGFHSRWLRGLVDRFASCASAAFRVMDGYAKFGEIVDMESVYLNLTLDVVGLTVFGADFSAVKQPPDRPQSPIVRAVYRVLKETGYRTENPLNLLLAQAPDAVGELSPGVREFRASMRQLDEVLEDAIEDAQLNRTGLGMSELQERDGGTLLQFLVDAKGQDTDSTQLRDDLRTLLIAGHETVASILTWATFELSRNAEVLRAVRSELEQVLEGRVPNYEDVRELKYLRLAITETLRLYPAPPFLFRRALAGDTLPQGGSSSPVPLERSSLVLVQTAMLHRNPSLYEEPDRFWPERWMKPFSGNGTVSEWRGYDPSRVTGLYPTEAAADFAFLPFGAGEYKCIGDQFAMIEATVILAMMLQRYDIRTLQSSLDDVGVDLAATIHTKRGLSAKVQKICG